MAKRASKKQIKKVTKKARMGSPSDRSKLQAKAKTSPYENPDELPDIGVEYDVIHLNGEEEEIAEFERARYDSVFGIDLRSEDVEVVREIARCIADPKLTADYTGFGESEKICIAYDGKQKLLKMTAGRKAALRAAANFLKSDYEVRVFRESTMDDTIECLIKPKHWWKAMDRRFRERMNDVFVKLKDLDWG